MILYVSDVSLKGSGYSSIGINLCKRLEGYHDEHVVCLSIGYDGSEHYHEFGLVPTTPKWLPQQISALVAARDIDVSAIIIALDIPNLLDLYNRTNFGHVPVIAIFPVEAGPLCDTWSVGLWQFYERFVMSEYGVKACEDSGLMVEHLPIPAELPEPVTSHKTMMEKLGIDGRGKFTILTVADNQERKNLSAALEGFKIFSEWHPDSIYVLVTRMNSPIGWKLEDLAREFNIRDKVHFVERGLSDQHLANLYDYADVFLLTSKAEGLGLPVREAMLVGTPVVATACTGILEQLEQGGGYGIPPAHVYRDPFGNGRRFFVDPHEVAHQLNHVYGLPDPELREMTGKAYEYARSFSWDESAAKLKQVLREILLQESEPLQM